MNTLLEIQHAIRHLSTIERESLGKWLNADKDSSSAVAEPVHAYGAPQGSRLLTADEYLELEQGASVRHEFVAGTLYAMAGPSESHHRIAGSIFAALHTHLRGGPCGPYILDFKLRLKIAGDDVFYYPDVMVACGREGVYPYYLQHPKLIVEVLSPSTERVDRREKAFHYRQIATLEEYILVAQDRPFLEIYRRADDWQPTAAASLGAAAEFRSLDLSLPLQQIYENVPDTGMAATT